MQTLVVFVSILLILDPCSSCSSGSNKNQIENDAIVKIPSLPKFSNIDWALKGYNILEGNPLQSGTAGDPGFTIPIFKAEYKGKTNADSTFMLPEGMSGQKKKICKLESETKQFSNEKDYQEELSQKAGLNLDLGSFLPFSFGANAEYQDQTKKMNQENNLVVLTENECTVYVVDLSTDNPPTFVEGFLVAAARLENITDTDAYLEFFGNYGTHYLSKTHMGARYAVETEFTSQVREEFYKEGFNINNGAEFSFAGVALGAKYESNDTKALAKKFEEKTVNTLKVAYGSNIPPSGKVEDWFTSAFDEPLPIRYELKEISDLFTDTFMANTGLKYTKIFDQLKHYLKTYCVLKKDELAIDKKDKLNCNGTSSGCNGGHDCHHHATCTDTEKGYKCKCNEGYDGDDGKTCRNWQQYQLPNDRYPKADDAEIPGNWKQEEICPKYHYAYKFALKLEPYQGRFSKDDTALNGVKLYCVDKDGKKPKGEITGGVGEDGTWTDEKGCHNGGFFVGYRFAAIDNAGTGYDDYYGENIDMKCTNEEILKGDESEAQGKRLEWLKEGRQSSMTSCQGDSLICGLQTKILDKGIQKDDVGLTNIRFICCSEQ